VSALNRPLVRGVVEEAFLPGGGGDGETAMGAYNGPTDAEPASIPPGSTGPHVRTAQRKLAAKGFPHSDTPGHYGASTVGAVQGFQRSVGLRAHGHLDPPTLEALDSNSNTEFVT
jgi:peptidoglycan hydrolase-like protein with peptidoglycan-binding domain